MHSHIAVLSRYCDTRATRSWSTVTVPVSVYRLHVLNTSLCDTPIVNSNQPMRVIGVNMERHRNERTGEREIPEKTRRPTASSGTIPTCANFRPVQFLCSGVLVVHATCVQSLPVFPQPVRAASSPGVLFWGGGGGSTSLRPMNILPSILRCRIPLPSPPEHQPFNAVLRADEGEARWVWSSVRIKWPWGNGRSPRKPAEQRHRTARFPHVKIRERPRHGIEPGSPRWESNTQRRLSGCCARSPGRRLHKAGYSLLSTIFQYLCAVPRRPPASLRDAAPPRGRVETSITIYNSVFPPPFPFTLSRTQRRPALARRVASALPARQFYLSPGNITPLYRLFMSILASHQRVFSGISRFPPPLHSGAAPYPHRFDFIGSQDLDVKGRSNLFTHSNFVQLKIHPNFPIPTVKRLKAFPGVSHCDAVSPKKKQGMALKTYRRVALAERLACSPPTKANELSIPGRSLSDFRR
ncbi:hypothetical protein PR048_028707 [Dryococelus australis]|uniref:Uncharacterized protein n=1 Tax=Dryococelus australis TaxID=614101 RepID=A0ABQ9GDZ6_9NEOP|nr:hypothetical protein PR048_028707 [Dryococelus australis]